MRHIKNIVVGLLENELIFLEIFDIIYIQELKKIFSPPFFKIPLFSGVSHKDTPTYAGVVHRLVRRPSKPDRRVRFPLPAPL